MIDRLCWVLLVGRGRRASEPDHLTVSGSGLLAPGEMRKKDDMKIISWTERRVGMDF